MSNNFVVTQVCQDWLAPQGSKEALGRLDFKVKRDLPAGLAYQDKQVFTASTVQLFKCEHLLLFL